MIRMLQFRDGQAAKDYYTSALAKGDYYMDAAEHRAIWRGEAARLLGLLDAEVTAEAFGRLADNHHPESGDPLTPRYRDGRTAGYDINFHVPKSVSVLHAIMGDERIVEAIRQSVQETMREIERQAMTRVRVLGQRHDRATGNLVWGEFVHRTTRPVDGVPDPHLHVHCFVMNATWDAGEGRFKAGQFREINREMPYYEAAYHSRLAVRLDKLGYATEKTTKGWEIAGVPASVTRKFSKRTEEIEKLAEKLGITDATTKARLGAKTRSRKAKDMDDAGLLREWGARLDPSERAAIDHVGAGQGKSRDATLTDRQALDHAIADRFERQSTIRESRLLEAALRHGVGRVTPEGIRAEAAKHPDLIRGQADGEQLVTTRRVLAEERAMLAFARDGRGTRPAIAGKTPWEGGAKLNRHQKAAVGHVLTSPDRVMLIRGGAGTGKTTLMREAVDAMEARGTPVYVVAPSAEASRGVLRASGFPGAETLQKFLGTPELQAKARKGVVWCDEAGLVGTPDMVRLFEVAKKLDARVVLSGDSRQHAPVQRGDALRLLESHAGLKPAEVLSVVRQQGTYREAIEAMSQGRFDKGIQMLDTLKAIREIPEGDRQVAMARDYVETIRTGRSCLVVAPTNAEGEAISGLIRAELKHAGVLAQEQTVVPRHRDLAWTQAEKADASRYAPGQVVRFHRNVRGFKPGEVLHVVDRDAKGRVRVQGTEAKAKPRVLPLAKSGSFAVFEESQLPLAKGDRVRFTRNGRTRDGKHRLDNGAVYRVQGVSKAGHIKLSNGWEIDRGFGHITHGYASTSHASQGKSVDRVLISQSWGTLPAATAEQFYVSVSRGKQEARLYTDDRQALIESVSRLSQRRAAVELTQETEVRKAPGRLAQHALMVQRLRAYERTRTGIVSRARARSGQSRGGIFRGR